MLSQLYIKNIAVISEATIDFSQGLNVFTGETGAGKTILISAINAVLGERASREMIRAGEEKAVISALFTDISPSARKALEEAGYSCEEDSVLIHRELSVDGRSLCKIDGKPATAAILRTVTGQLINIHGQHDNQQLLSPQKHLGFIDSFGDLGEELHSYQTAYQAYDKVRRELESVNMDETQKNQRIDLLSYQVDEIDQAALQPQEEEELKGQRRLIKNALDITQALGGSMVILEGDGESSGLNDQLSNLIDCMTVASRYLEKAVPIADRLTELSYEFEGFTSDIRQLLEELDCDPARLDEIERRLDLIYGLKRKYGPDIPSILEFRDKAWRELETIQTSDQRIQQLQTQLEGLLEDAQKKGEKLSKARAKAAQGFVKAVQAELVFLDMPSVTLSVDWKHKPLSLDGMDDVELFISTNKGESAKSLAKVASGGELARVMLSIKNVLAHRDGIQTMIFDEVDTGVSGQAAQKIGRKLAQVSADRQVIVVTHLAQVASFAKHHLLIAKGVREERTFTTITPLNREQRVRELARITGGEQITKLALERAEEMLREAGN